MKIRAIDQNGDWVFGQSKGSYLVGIDAIIQDINTALYTFTGECFWDYEFGVDWLNLIGAKMPQAQQNIILQTREIISSRDGVLKINSVTPSFSNYRRNLTIVYDVTTRYGRVSSTFTNSFTSHGN